MCLAFLEPLISFPPRLLLLLRLLLLQRYQWVDRFVCVLCLWARGSSSICVLLPFFHANPIRDITRTNGQFLRFERGGPTDVRTFFLYHDGVARFLLFIGIYLAVPPSMKSELSGRVDDLTIVCCLDGRIIVSLLLMILFLPLEDPSTVYDCCLEETRGRAEESVWIRLIVSVISLAI